MSLSAADYEKRFGQRFTMNKERNALGFGVNNAYYPPLKDYKNLNTWIERKIALTTAPPPNPFYLLAIYLQGYATVDSVWDAYYYANAQAAGDQVYPYGIHLFFDMHSLWGYGEFCWEWFINMCWNLSYLFTLFIPIFACHFHGQFTAFCAGICEKYRICKSELNQLICQLLLYDF